MTAALNPLRNEIGFYFNKKKKEIKKEIGRWRLFPLTGHVNNIIFLLNHHLPQK